MSCFLACASHGPAIALPKPRAAQHEAVVAGYASVAARLQAFDPELIVIFAPDHYAGVHLSLVPPFCIAMECEALADYGGFPGVVNVPRDIAVGCLEHLRDCGFDPSVSHHMLVDHGFSQPLTWFTGAVDRYPVLPILINTTCHPVSRFKRIRQLGEAVGQFAKGLGRRVAFIGSGGLSHHPANIFPQQLQQESAEIREYLTYGGMRGGMLIEDWLRYLGERTIIGGELVARGERTAAEFRINPDWDARFLELITGDCLDVFDAWDPVRVVEQAGVAAMEVQQWLAARSAAAVCGVRKPVVDLYVATVEYRIAVGVMHADPL